MKHHITLRLDPELVKRIEAYRPAGLTRSGWIAHLLEKQVEFIDKFPPTKKWEPKPKIPQIEASVEPTVQSEVADTHWNRDEFSQA